MAKTIDITKFDYIISHFDGNNNDEDDIAALPIAAALINGAGLEDKTTFFYHNNLAEPNNQKQLPLMKQSAAFAEKLGIDTYDYQTDISGTTDELVQILNSGKKVLAIEGGPMEAIYRGLEKTNPQNLGNITLVSHSKWNEDRDVATRNGVNNVRTWADIENNKAFDDVELIGSDIVTNQNKGTNNKTGFWSNKWSWLDNTDNPVLKEARNLMETAGYKRLIKKNDASDAGMHFFAITGQKDGNPDDAKAFFDNNSPEYSSNSNNPVVPPTPPSDELVIGLYDAGSDTLIETIENGDKITVNSTDNLTIAATASKNSPVESVFLNLNNGQVTRRENAAPYALFGDEQNDFMGGSISEGSNSITLKAYSQDNLKGTLLETLNRDFTIVVKDAEPPKPPQPGNPQGSEILISFGNANNNGNVLGTAQADIMRAEADNSSGNRLRALGRDGNDTLTGANNVDISGGNGDDLLILNGGNSFIWGGNGKDTFVVSPETASGSTILDFQKGVDTIVFEEIEGVSSMSDLSITPQNPTFTANSFINFGDEQIKIKGMMVEDFSAEDFQFS